jgi:hypothetical protein
VRLGLLELLLERAHILGLIEAQLVLLEGHRLLVQLRRCGCDALALDGDEAGAQARQARAAARSSSFLTGKTNAATIAARWRVVL